MKAFLKNSDGAFYPLGPKVSTIGRESCDITLQTPGVDQQHAIIEYSEQEDCYVLQDLNTAQGTYVNDVRVQNAAVRLAPCDVIRFGYSGTPFELQMENPPPISYPPVQQRPAWTQPLTLLTDQNAHVQSHQPRTGLPYLTTATMTYTLPSTVWTPSTNQGPLPRPPLRSRPLSAGAIRRAGMERFQTLGSPVMSPGPPLQQSMNGGWVTSTGGRTMVSAAHQGIPGAQQADIIAMQEKEQKILQLSEEVSRLRSIEMESFRKDQQLQLLQQKVNEVEQRLSQQPPLIMGGDVDLTQKLIQLENEVTARRNEVSMLKEQLSGVQLDINAPRAESPSHLRDELAEKHKELNNIRNELERAKKDKNITSGLVTQMQRDMSNKDSTISRMAREMETLKKELRERDSQLSNLNNKIKGLKDAPKSTDERDAREKELISLRQKFKTTENKMQDQQELISSLKQEMEKMKLSTFEEKEIQKKLQAEVDQAKAEFVDMQRAERMVRVDLEQQSKKGDRFRNRVVQVTFSTPDISAPESEISDDELLETLKKLIDERTESLRQVKELDHQLKLADSSSSEFQKHVGDLRKNLEDVVAHLQENGHHTRSLKQELSVMKSVSIDESMAWVKDSVVELLSNEIAWEHGIESALERCGVNVKLTSGEPGKHIMELYEKLESAVQEKERLTAHLGRLEQDHKAEIEVHLGAQREDVELRITDAVERARLEGEEKLNRAIDEIRAVEAEKRENAIEAERRRIEEMQEKIDELRQNLRDKQEGDEEKLSEAANAVSELEEYKALEEQLRDEMQRLAAAKDEELERLRGERGELEKKLEDDLIGYKEQIKQHSVTICAMEERLNKVMKKNKDYQDEITEHKKTIQDLKNRPPVPAKPPPPPKPKVIIQKPSQDYLAMEQLIVVLRKENLELKKQIQGHEDVVLGLRRDLAGASARLSDITGELSEAQKRDLEKNKELLLQREKELAEIRQQMAKLSQIVDKQKDELRALEEELSKEKSISAKYKTHMDEKLQRIKSLESQLSDEKDEQKKQLEMLDQEGRITSEMTSLGAQCRGERHEQVISRQREALGELRARVKSLEQSRPPLPTQDQALQQVILLKKELAEMRANQALNEDTNVQSITSLDREVGRARGLLSTVNAEADMERSAHRETMDALETSENAYLTLLRAMASCLELEDIDGLRPLGHIPKDERDRLLTERENSCELLANRIKVMKERIARKDELLQGYERDLAKLRQAQELAERKSTQVDSLANDVRSRTEESQYLRESLNRTKDRLDQEKRLNTAIKQRKTFHLENERVHLAPTSHRCKQPDRMGKEAARKRAQQELLKRRNYEIKALKGELTDREKTLFDRENRLYTLENSLGQERSVEVLE